MATKSTAPKAKRKLKSKAKRKPKKAEAQKTQAARFKETARKLGVDETGKQFEDAFAKIVPSKKRE